VYSVMVVGQ